MIHSMVRVLLMAGVLLSACTNRIENNGNEISPAESNPKESPYLVILGTLQDGGSPHTGCTKICCKDLFLKPDPQRMVVSLGLVDPRTKKNWLFEASPDFPKQLKELNNYSSPGENKAPEGIFLTHAHIGHYTGLMYLGREVMDAQLVKVYAMPVMKNFLEKNGPWSQLVSADNINIREIEEEKEISLANDINVIPFRVPHRDEFSETVGYIINGPAKKVLFIPDIDKWSKWNRNIIEEIKKVDYAFIDGTFYDGKEINNRDISEIPHPFVVESLELFQGLSLADRAKIYFIHFNHTNPLINPHSGETGFVLENGFHIGQKGQVFPL